MGSLVPASGAAGLALGAWVLHRGGMDGQRIARRSVAFFLIKSGVNFVAVAVLGTVMALGVGPQLSPWLTAFPAVLATLALAAVAAVAAPRARGAPRRRTRPAGRLAQAGGGATDGSRGAQDPALGKRSRARRIDRLLGVRQRCPLGDLPCLRRLPPVHGDPDGLSDRPARRAAADSGGIGGIDGGLIGTLIVYGAPAAGTAAAVLAYRVILFWLPLIVGGIAFAALRRDMPGSYELASCAPAIAAQSA